MEQQEHFWTIASTIYFEPGSCGSPAVLSEKRALGEFRHDTMLAQKYPEHFPKYPSITFKVQTVVHGKWHEHKFTSDKDTVFCPCGFPHQKDKTCPFQPMVHPSY